MANSFAYDPKASKIVLGKTDVPIMSFENNPEAPWFKAKPIIKYLEYQSITNVLKKLEDDDKSDLSTLLNTQGKPLEIADALTPGYHEGKALWINEFGLYDLIMGSGKPAAKQFKRWITHDVIPRFRKRGLADVFGEVEKVLLAAPSEAKQGFVYAATSPLLNAVKIGSWTGTIDRLYSRYQTYVGCDVEIVVAFCQDCRAAECKSIQKFASSSLGGELFAKDVASEIAAFVGMLEEVSGANS